jgi:hypothetical protein
LLQVKLTPGNEKKNSLSSKRSIIIIDKCCESFVGFLLLLLLSLCVIQHEQEREKSRYTNTRANYSYQRLEEGKEVSFLYALNVYSPFPASYHALPQWISGRHNRNRVPSMQ